MLRSKNVLLVLFEFLSIAALVGATYLPAAAATGSIRGSVCDQTTGKPLAFANVVLVGTTLGAMVVGSGEFHIKMVPVGVYRIQASYVGYDHAFKNILVREGKVTVVSFCKSQGLSRPDAAVVRLEPMPDPTTGEFRVIGDHQGRLPLRETNVSVSVSGSMAKVSVEQTFKNFNAQSIEAVYVFPLPHQAAVTAMSMRIGERQLEAKIRTRQEATRIYQEARMQGRTAALLEQERPNIFTQHVANLMPGNDVVVRIEYAEQLNYDHGRYELVIPTVVGPRFIPGTLAGNVAVSSATKPTNLDPRQRTASRSGEVGAFHFDRASDASRITSPNLGPGKDSGHRLKIHVDLDAGLPLSNVESVHHSVIIKRPGAGQAIISTRTSDTIPNKDFVLRYWPRTGRADVGILAHRAKGDDHGYFTLIMESPEPPEATVPAPRELLLVLDVSGSMRGAPIEAMKGVVRQILQRLNRQDSFNIVTFSITTHVYAPGSLVANSESVQKALRHIELLRGDGGTLMRQGLNTAFALRSESTSQRTICLLTDGLVGNDAQLIHLVRSRIGNDQLFAIGIGSSPNRFLVDGLVEEGMGAQDFVSLDEDPREVVDRFFSRINSPILSGLRIDWGNLKVEDVQPPQLPDLYRGQVLRVTGRYRKPGRGQVVIHGMRGKKAFEQRVQVELPRHTKSHAALRSLWARTQILELNRLYRAGDANAAEQIESIGLQFALMTDYTAFVVTDNQTVNDKGVPRLIQQPVEMPQGIRHEAILGRASNGLARRPAGSVKKVLVTGNHKRVDLKSSGVSHVTPQEYIAVLPIESVSEALVLNAGRVVQGGELHVRGGRSAEISVRSQRQTRLRVVIDLVEATINRGKTVQLRIRVKNQSEHEIKLPGAYQLHDGTLRVRVRYAGKILPIPTVVISEVQYDRALQPGEEREYLVKLNGPNGFALNKRGRYLIAIINLLGVQIPNDQRLRYVNVR